MVSKSYRNSCYSITVGDGQVYSFSTKEEMQAFERGVEWRSNNHGVHVSSLVEHNSRTSWLLMGSNIRTKRPCRSYIDGLNKSTANAFFKGCKTKVNRSL